MKALVPIDVLDFDDALWVTSNCLTEWMRHGPLQMNQRSIAGAMCLPQSDSKHNEQPRAGPRRGPSLHLLTLASFTDDKLRDFDIICRIKTPIQAVPDLVNKFVFSWTALAFNDDGVGTFEGVSDKNVDNLPHGILHL